METPTGKLSLSVPVLPEIPPALRQARLQELTANITDVPALSSVGMSLIQELTRSDTSVKKLTDIINAEPVVAAKVLRHANSAYYGITHKIQTVHHAITMLGLAEIKEIAFNLYFYSFTRSHSDSASEFFERYLRRSITTATLCKKICSHYGFQAVGLGEAYLAGLLQNIGVFLLFRFRRKKYMEAVELRETHEIPLYAAEEQVFGCNHADVGGWLAQQWNLPENLQEVIRFHHRPTEEVVNKELLAIVQMADLVCNEMGITLAKSNPPRFLDPIVVKTWQSRFPGASAEEIAQQALKQFGGVCLSAAGVVHALEDAPVAKPTPPEARETTAKPETPAPSVEAKTAEGWEKPPQPIPLGPSVLICGLGQILRGKIARGLLLMVTFCVCLALFFLSLGQSTSAAAIGLLGTLAIWVVNLRDVLRMAEEAAPKSS